MGTGACKWELEDGNFSLISYDSYDNFFHIDMEAFASDYLFCSLFLDYIFLLLQDCRDGSL